MNDGEYIKREEKFQQVLCAVIFARSRERPDPTTLVDFTDVWHGGRLAGSLLRSTDADTTPLFSPSRASWVCTLCWMFAVFRVIVFCYTATLFNLCRVVGVAHLFWATFFFFCVTLFEGGTNCVGQDPHFFFMSGALRELREKHAFVCVSRTTVSDGLK